MELTDQEKKVQEEAVGYVHSHTNELIDRFVVSKKPEALRFFGFFTAGSPGAGKTEFIDNFIPLVFREVFQKFNIAYVPKMFVKLDADEIRAILPQYKRSDPHGGIKGNARVVQRAAGVGLGILRDYCIEYTIPFIQDGTFSNYHVLRSVIKQILSKNGLVWIFYIYLDPVFAWDFTRKRELIEGRDIPKDDFIKQFFCSRENVDMIKEEFGDQVTVNCIIKDKENKVYDMGLDVGRLDSFLDIYYKRGVIKRYTAEELLIILQ